MQGLWPQSLPKKKLRCVRVTEVDDVVIYGEEKLDKEGRKRLQKN